MIENPREEPFVRIYKDLLISKRVLTDLRQSISNTLSNLKQTKPKYSLSGHQKNRRESSNHLSHHQRAKGKGSNCHKCGENFEPAAPHQCRASVRSCPICSQVFDNQAQVIQHLKANNHHYCSLCHSQYKQSQIVHDTQICGNRRLGCPHCGAKVRRKNLDQHVQECCFRQCSKCLNKVYYECYGYHIIQCKGKERIQVNQNNEFIQGIQIDQTIQRNQSNQRIQSTQMTVTIPKNQQYQLTPPMQVQGRRRADAQIQNRGRATWHDGRYKNYLPCSVWK